MLRPNAGELLGGLRRSLEEQVLPALPRGVPQQQLKAALHLIRRLQRSWDLAPSHLREDNADMTATLGALFAARGGADVEDRLGAAPRPAVPGFNDPALAAAATRNLMLQQLVAEEPDGVEIRALHRRMTARDARYVGDVPEPESST
ncbi:hypothetical protein F9288_00900 [Sphingomonas sp. CL5.1]|uniref:hypothetical protein n=1 Tax=Sphingomonas sp. CL5.1 TaxID=2653203 RepID=UPI0015826F6D|nr:hypothetical protein [Sphingomonas sp. CL5.1]QKR98356.1 hypothetical protein F9288_00900 [Sphingomonas sp. CL5.1]